MSQGNVPFPSGPLHASSYRDHYKH